MKTVKMILCAALLLGLTGCVHANLHFERLGGPVHPGPHPLAKRGR
jgi:hypothetical protein